MANQFSVPSAPAVYRAKYSNFVGCDFVSDPFAVDSHRFPDALNLMLDKNGCPEKRPGYRAVLKLDGAIKLVRRFVLKGNVFYFFYAGTSISVRGEDIVIATHSVADITDVQNCFFAVYDSNVYAYVKHSDSYKVYRYYLDDDLNLTFSDNALSDADIPTTGLCGRLLTAEDFSYFAEEDVSAGFETLQSSNLLTSSRVNTFKMEEGYEVFADENSNPEDAYYRLRKPRFFFPDIPFDLPSDAKKFILGLYLRIFFVVGSDYANHATGTYSKEWDAVYGSGVGYDTYSNWLLNSGTTSAYPLAYYMENVSDDLSLTDTSSRRVVVNGSYAAALFRYVENSGFFSFKGDEASNCARGFFQDGVFGFEVYVQNEGYVRFPMFSYAENYDSYGHRFELLWRFGGFDLSENDFSLEGCSFSHILLYRVGCRGSGPSSVGYPFYPDTTVPDNYKLTFRGYRENEADALEKIFGSEYCTLYGVLGNSDRVFVAGSGEEAHYVRYSEMGKPLYFPDLNYLVCGSSNTKVLTMFPSNGSLVVAKEPNGQDVNMFLVQGSMSSGEAVFTVSEGLPGVGVVSKSAVRYVDDSPHFLSENGVLRLQSNQLNSRLASVNCSFFADPLLLKENLSVAAMGYFRKMLLVAFPDTGNCYVFSTKDKTSTVLAGNDRYVYECWRWDNIHATCFLNDGKRLLFGTEDGTVNCFMFDEEGAEKYNDNGASIPAYFMTKAFDDGSFTTLKNMRKRGCGIVLKPFVRSSCQIAVVTDSFNMDLRSASADIFSWEYIDFSRFDFSTNQAVRIVPFNQKVKKYSTIQFVVKNDVVNESFGVLGIEKAYTLGNFKKN